MRISRPICLFLIQLRAFMKLSFRSFIKLVAPVFYDLLLVSALAADYQVKTREHPLPDKVAPEIASTMETKAYEIFKGEDLVYRFWFRKGFRFLPTLKRRKWHWISLFNPH
jgi:hypothetical protein